MNAKFHKRLFFITLLVMATQLVFAAISSGIVDERNKDKKYSLNNLNRFSQKYIPLRSLKSGFSFSGSTILNDKSTGSAVVNELIQFENGNATYVIPYNFKIKMTKVAKLNLKFKAPVPPAAHP